MDRTDLDAGLNELQWVVDAFLVTLAGLLVLASGLADRFGRRRIFILGMALFAASSLLAAAAERPEVLIGARALMGAAIACVLPTALALITVMFDGDERTRAVAIWAAIAGLGMSAGPLIGGLLIDVAGWRWIFLFNVPFALAAVPAAL
jgi:MFS family permease